MRSRLQVGSHPIQPMLVTLPFGLFVVATLFDLADVLGGLDFLGQVGYWIAVAALVSAALAAVAGLVDLWDTPGDRTRRTAIRFNVVNVVMAGLFLVACLIRAGASDRGATGVLLLLEILGLMVGAVGVALGAALVRRFERAASEPADETTGIVPAGGRHPVFRPAERLGKARAS